MVACCLAGGTGRRAWASSFLSFLSRFRAPECVGAAFRAASRRVRASGRRSFFWTRARARRYLASARPQEIWVRSASFWGRSGSLSRAAVKEASAATMSPALSWRKPSSEALRASASSDWRRISSCLASSLASVLSSAGESSSSAGAAAALRLEAAAGAAACVEFRRWTNRRTHSAFHARLQSLFYPVILI